MNQDIKSLFTKSADRGVGGSSYTHSMYYEYDEMYRLKEASHGASGGFSNGSDYASLEGYSLTYSPSGNITSKSVSASILTPGGNVGVYYNNTYNYNGRPHTVSHIYGQELEFEWDGSGNMTRQFDYRTETQRRMRWDEENRLKGVYDSEQRLSSYLYDAGGERTLKMSGTYQSTYINSSLTISSVSMNDYTLYTSPYMVMTDNEYTKHYYVEADRVASKIGGGMANAIHDVNQIVLGFDIQSENDYQSKTHEVDLMMRHDFDNLEVGVDVEVSLNLDYPLYGAVNQNGTERELIYFFHKDHLGSSTQISDISANIIHHIEYMPYGETFVEQRSNWGTNYKFNGKELDEETGYYYYGARYYTPDLSIWLSVDPLSDERSWLSPYNYCQWNPVKRIDPDGALDEEWFYNYETKSLELLSDNGGKNTQIVHVGKTNENGGRTSVGTVVYDGPINDFFTDNSNVEKKEVNWTGVADGTASTIGGIALIASGFSIGVASSGILSLAAVPIVMEGAYQTTQGLGKITSSLAGVSSDKLPYSTTIGSIAQNRNVDNWASLITGVTSGGVSYLKTAKVGAMDVAGGISSGYSIYNIINSNDNLKFTVPKGSKIIMNK